MSYNPTINMFMMLVLTLYLLYVFLMTNGDYQDLNMMRYQVF